jgi:hypothetical protein
MTNDTLIRAAQGMIRHHGKDAEIKAESRADRLEYDSGMPPDVGARSHEWFALYERGAAPSPDQH